MGQYYAPIVETLEGKCQNYSLTRGTGLKLTEHSWWENSDCNGIAKMIYKNPSKVAWVGDYYNDNEEEKVLYNKAYVRESETEIPYPNGFTLNDKYLVNHDKKLYVDLNEYNEKSLNEEFEESAHPVPLLTACGNGRGGGDYLSPVNQALVGSWAMDSISIEDEIPQNYAKLDVYFTEDAEKVSEWNKRENSYLTPEKLGSLSIEESDTYESDDGNTTIYAYYVDCDMEFDELLFNRLAVSEPTICKEFLKNNGVKSWNEFVEKEKAEDLERPYINMTWDVDYKNKTIGIMMQTVLDNRSESYDIEDAYFQLTDSELKVIYPYFCDLIAMEAQRLASLQEQAKQQSGVTFEDRLIDALKKLPCGETLTVEEFGYANKMSVEKEYDEDCEINCYNFTFSKTAPKGMFVSDDNLEIGTVYDVDETDLKETIAQIKDGSLKITTEINKTDTLKSAAENKKIKSIDELSKE